MTERAYLDLLQDILDNGVDRDDRTGTGTRGVFGRQFRFDLCQGFPLLTTKKVFLRGIIEELLWFLRGSTNAKELEDKNVNIWKGWGDPETRELGPVYGKQWRKWESPDDVVEFHSDSPFVVRRTCMGGNDQRPYRKIRTIDQISDLVTRLKADPNSRRHLVVAWNPGEIEHMALPPCHCLFQFFVEPLDARVLGAWCATFEEGYGRQPTADEEPKGRLSCQLYQRSADMFLGVPFNIASYSLLTIMLAQQCGFLPGDFVHTFGDAHIYHNHFDQVREQLSREPYPFPRMEITKAADIFSYTVDDFKLVDYVSHPAIKAPVAI